MMIVLLCVWFSTVYCRCKASLPAVVAKLAQVDTLPCAEVKVSVGDWNSESHTHHRRFEVRRHVVVSFQIVCVFRVAVWYKSVGYHFHVYAYRRVGVFVDGECRRSMFDKQIQQPTFWQRTECFGNLRRYKVEPSRFAA